jgi:hypothetical protein
MARPFAPTNPTDHPEPPERLKPEIDMASKLGMIWDFLQVRKKWWLTPIVLFLLLLGLLIVLTQGSALAPFIYTLF